MQLKVPNYNYLAYCAVIRRFGNSARSKASKLSLVLVLMRKSLVVCELPFNLTFAKCVFDTYDLFTIWYQQLPCILIIRLQLFRTSSAVHKDDHGTMHKEIGLYRPSSLDAQVLHCSRSDTQSLI